MIDDPGIEKRTSLISRAAWRWWEITIVAVVLLVLVVWQNHDFMGYVSSLTERVRLSLHGPPPDIYFASTDEYFLIRGYQKHPNLWQDGLAWWHGTWIHQYTRFFRPLASYLHWMQCHVGLRWGFAWLAGMGLLLFYVGCLLAAALAWRITRSKPFTLLGALLIPFSWFFNPGQPKHWMAWFPFHPDLIVGALLLGAVLCFDLWIERGRPRLLLGSWLLFALACGFKEHAYIFPAMALALAALRAGKVPKTKALLQAGAMSAATLLLLVYRKAVVPEAFTPPLDPVAYLVRPLAYVYPLLNKPIRYGMFDTFSLAVLLFVQGWAWLRLRRTGPGRRWVERPFTPVVNFFFLAGMAALSAGATGSLILFADPLIAAGLLGELAQYGFTFYCMTLFAKYRKERPTALSWALLWLTYVPIIFTTGWYYTTIGWLFRAQYWALAAQLIWRDLKPHLPGQRP